ncbi:DNA polymerase III subunit gamma/tau [Lactiplantibacillus modestisalitolerans]|uniref:Uncharacterized protein n=1 Tax=Lactiplantibacillus modestisalitolerans TaxID=1457219 RepID=A0ABV5WSG7_9LACO|nr:DNA polymerase III subunit gamma/tau [Lactiplantibacillus modestisalitolerans]
MFNSGAKKEAIARMNRKNEQFKKTSTQAVHASTSLFKTREILKERIEEMWVRINAFRNKPEKLKLTLKQVKVTYERYDGLVQEARVANEQKNVKAGTTAGATVVAGAGVAALGPSAAMAIATTFGTASTGTAISALSGAAATNAALAWLGGGAAAAGGGGMAAGSGFLALAGPVGWTLAGIGLGAGGLIANGKNKKIAHQANEATEKIQAQIKILQGTINEIKMLEKNTSTASNELVEMNNNISDYDTDYNQLSSDQQFKLGAAVNDVLSFAKLLNKTVGK